MWWSVSKARKSNSSKRSLQFANWLKPSSLLTLKNLQRPCIEFWERQISNPTSCSPRCLRRRETALWSDSESSRSMCSLQLIWLLEVLMCPRLNLSSTLTYQADREIQSQILTCIGLVVLEGLEPMDWHWPFMIEIWIKSASMVSSHTMTWLAKSMSFKVPTTSNNFSKSWTKCEKEI